MRGAWRTVAAVGTVVRGGVTRGVAPLGLAALVAVLAVLFSFPLAWAATHEQVWVSELQVVTQWQSTLEYYSATWPTWADRLRVHEESISGYSVRWWFECPGSGRFGEGAKGWGDPPYNYEVVVPSECLGATVSVIAQPYNFYSDGPGTIKLWAYAGSNTPPPLPTEGVPAGSDRNPPDPSGGTSRDPVHTSTGSYTYTHTDVATSGRGPTVVFARTYNSNDSRVGPLGPGWTHNYAARLTRPDGTTSDVVVVGPQGRSDHYTLVDGVYTPPAGTYTTLRRNPNDTWTVSHRDQSTWTFDSGGKLTGVTDRYGNQSTLTYTGSQLTGISDPAGRGSLSLSYDTCFAGRLCQVSDWASPARVVQFSYDASGRLSSVTDRENKSTSFAYDGTSQRLTSITDARGNVAVTHTYDAQGRVATQKDAKGLATGQQTEFAYNDATRITTVTYPATSFDPSWRFIVEDSYDAQGRLIQRVSKPTASSADWATETYGYDGNSNRTSWTDARGHTTNLCYDVDYAGVAIAGSQGNLTRRIDPAPNGTNRPVTLFQYDGKNNLVQTVSPKGVNSGQGIPSSETNPCGVSLAVSTTLYATNLVYDPLTETKLETVTRRYVDPDLGQQTAVTKLEYQDEANPGLVTRVIPPRGNTGPSPDYSYATSFSYYGPGSQAGMLESVVGPPVDGNPTGYKTAYSYDAIGRRLTMVDPNGYVAGGVPSEHTWEYAYDNEDRLRFVKAPPPASGGSQLVTEFTYDVAGNREVAIDANGQVTKYVYDQRDSLQEVQQSPDAWTWPDRGQPLPAPPASVVRTTYSYDHLGNLAQVKRARYVQGDPANDERAVDYAYDGLNVRFVLLKWAASPGKEARPSALTT
ncbi:MAG: RHS repeat protein, partial [Chloroflexi bacterium]|nr:RHS repeat protein [Chloroflexota bacterium]